MSSLHGWCQIVMFCMMVSNYPRCQIVVGVKLSSLHGRCQIILGVKLAYVSNCPITKSFKGNSGNYCNNPLPRKHKILFWKCRTAVLQLNSSVLALSSFVQSPASSNNSFFTWANSFLNLIVKCGLSCGLDVTWLFIQSRQ